MRAFSPLGVKGVISRNVTSRTRRTSINGVTLISAVFFPPELKAMCPPLENWTPATSPEFPASRHAGESKPGCQGGEFFILPPRRTERLSHFRKAVLQFIGG